MAIHIMEKLRGRFTWKSPVKVDASSHKVPGIAITEHRSHRTSSIMPIYPSDEEQEGKDKGKYGDFLRPPYPGISSDSVSSIFSSAEPDIVGDKSTTRRELRCFLNSIRTWRHAYVDERKRSSALRRLIVRRGRDLDSLVVDIDAVHTSASTLHAEIDGMLETLVAGLQVGTEDAVGLALLDVANRKVSLEDLEQKIGYHRERIAGVARRWSGDLAAVALGAV
ncbi:hypothetical protein ACJ41O_007728 [Fusarium nematophilum]